MSTFRSYFEKNNTLIKDNLTNNSQNPVTELIYGTEDSIYSRFIFKIDLSDITSKISTEGITIDKIQKHELNIANTIAVRSDLIGGFMVDEETRRASSFELRLFVIPESWDEGSGYDFVYNNNLFLPFNTGASNWFNRTTADDWSIDGIIGTGTTVLATQTFDKGNENVKIDITDYINSILYSGVTDYGLGLAYLPVYESGSTEERYSVGFHTKYTHTFFEPFVETVINDLVLDDRKYFYLDKTNKIYLYTKKAGSSADVTVNSVRIKNHNGDVIDFITPGQVTKERTGVYSITLNIDSQDYPDSIIFEDIWDVTDSSGKTREIVQSFFLKDPTEYYAYNQINRFEPDNIHFTFHGIGSGEIVKRGVKRRISIDYKQLYANNDIAFDLEYRLFTKQGGNMEIVVIDYTKVDRILNGYEFNLDTSWLIPSDYYLELRVIYDGISVVKNPIKFRIQSENQNFSIL